MGKIEKQIEEKTKAQAEVGDKVCAAGHMPHYTG
jgi:hypothetical protein